MTLPAGKVCITRPNRSRPRRFNLNDIARIAVNLRSQGYSEGEIYQAIRSEPVFVADDLIRALEPNELVGALEYVGDALDVVTTVLRAMGGRGRANRLATVATALNMLIDYVRRVEDYRNSVRIMSGQDIPDGGFVTGSGGI